MTCNLLRSWTDADLRERAESTARAAELELERMKRAGDLR
jgi:hypothetical protein